MDVSVLIGTVAEYSIRPTPAPVICLGIGLGYALFCSLAKRKCRTSIMLIILAYWAGLVFCNYVNLQLKIREAAALIDAGRHKISEALFPQGAEEEK